MLLLTRVPLPFAAPSLALNSEETKEWKKNKCVRKHIENRGEMSFIFSNVSQDTCRGTAKKLKIKYNSIAIAQNGKKVFHSEDIAYKIW